MRHKKARQRLASKRWDYTCRRNDDIFPVGYCSGDENDHRRFYHANGHTTEKEACECYKNYLLNNRFRKGTLEGVQYKCIECKKWTSNYVIIGSGIGQLLHLCDAHSTKEVVAKYFSVSESYES